MNFQLQKYQLYISKSLKDRYLGKQLILFPSNVNVSPDFTSENIEILGKTKLTVSLGSGH